MRTCTRTKRQRALHSAPPFRSSALSHAQHRASSSSSSSSLSSNPLRSCQYAGPRQPSLQVAASVAGTSPLAVQVRVIAALASLAAQNHLQVQPHHALVHAAASVRRAPARHSPPRRPITAAARSFPRSQLPWPRLPPAPRAAQHWRAVSLTCSSSPFPARRSCTGAVCRTSTRMHAPTPLTGERRPRCCCHCCAAASPAQPTNNPVGAFVPTFGAASRPRWPPLLHQHCTRTSSLTTGQPCKHAGSPSLLCCRSDYCRTASSLSCRRLPSACSDCHRNTRRRVLQRAPGIRSCSCYCAQVSVSRVFPARR